MNDNQPASSPLGRILASAFAGVVLGGLLEILLWWERPPEGTVRLPILGPSIGALTLASLGFFFGRRPLPVWLAAPAKGLLVGAVVGILSGAFLYAPLMASAEPLGHYEKALPVHKFNGVALGTPLGAVVGLVAVVAWRFLRPRSMRKP